MFTEQECLETIRDQEVLLTTGDPKQYDFTPKVEAAAASLLTRVQDIIDVEAGDDPIGFIHLDHGIVDIWIGRNVPITRKLQRLRARGLIASEAIELGERYIRFEKVFWPEDARVDNRKEAK